MHHLKSILAALSITLLPACLVGAFDDLQEKAEGGVYVNSHDKGGSNVGSFADALIPTGGSDGLNYYIVSDVPPTVQHVNFDQKGARDPGAAEVIQGPNELRFPAAVASDFSTSSDGSVAVAALGIVSGGNAQVAMFKGTFDTSSRQLASINVAGNMEPTSIAFGNTNAAVTVTDTTDMLVMAGAELNIVADYADKDAQTGFCGVLQGGNILLANLDATPDDEEVVIATDGEVFVTTAAQLESKMDPPLQSCGFGVDLNTKLTVPAGATEFGKVIASGNFNAGGLTDLVVASPGTNDVYVYMDWTLASPTEPVKIATPSSDSVAFGSTITVGDFDGDGQDELVVADPLIDISANSAAGRVYIYSGDGAGSFGTPIILHDARAESDQNFGRSLAAVPGFGSDRLIVGANQEVFTYFQTPLSGDADFRL